MATHNLKTLRMAAGMTLARAAEAMGLSQSGYIKLERGERQLTSNTIEKAAKAFGTTEDKIVGLRTAPTAYEVPGGPIWAVTPGHYRPPPTFFDNGRLLPVYASAEGGDGNLILSTDEIDRVPRPYTLDGIMDAYAILITGDSMIPAYEPGDYAWVNPVLPVIRDTDAILYSIREDIGDATASIKRVTGSTEKVWKLRQYNPDRAFELSKDKWQRAHRVTGKFHKRT